MKYVVQKNINKGKKCLGGGGHRGLPQAPHIARTAKNNTNHEFYCCFMLHCYLKRKFATRILSFGTWKSNKGYWPLGGPSRGSLRVSKSLKQLEMTKIMSFWAAVLKGTKSCRTQGDFALFACSLVCSLYLPCCQFIRSFVCQSLPLSASSDLQLALLGLVSALAGLNSVLRSLINYLKPLISPPRYQVKAISLPSPPPNFSSQTSNWLKQVQSAFLDQSGLRIMPLCYHIIIRTINQPAQPARDLTSTSMSPSFSKTLTLKSSHVKTFLELQRSWVQWIRQKLSSDTEAIRVIVLHIFV